MYNKMTEHEFEYNSLKLSICIIDSYHKNLWNEVLGIVETYSKKSQKKIKQVYAVFNKYNDWDNLLNRNEDILYGFRHKYISNLTELEKKMYYDVWFDNLEVVWFDEKEDEWVVIGIRYKDPMLQKVIIMDFTGLTEAEIKSILVEYNTYLNQYTKGFKSITGEYVPTLRNLSKRIATFNYLKNRK
jgi:hypothetical protein